MNSDVIDEKINAGTKKVQNEMNSLRTQTIDLINTKIASVSDALDSLSQLARKRSIEISKNKGFAKLRSYCTVLQAYISFNSMRIKDEFDPAVVSSNLTKSTDQAYDEFMTRISDKKEELKPIMDDPKRAKICVVSKFVRSSTSVFSQLKDKFDKSFEDDRIKLEQKVENITNSLQQIENIMNKSIDTCLELIDPSNCVSSFVSFFLQSLVLLLLIINLFLF